MNQLSDAFAYRVFHCVFKFNFISFLFYLCFFFLVGNMYTAKNVLRQPASADFEFSQLVVLS